MKKGFILFAMLLVFSLVGTNTAFAASINSPIQNYDVLESRIVEYEYDYSTDVMAVSVFEVKAQSTTAKATGYIYKSASHSKYFYIISSGEKVAEYSLTGNFRYDKGSGLAECRSTSTTYSSTKTGWTVSGSSVVDNITTALGAGRGDYSLYYNNNLNNTDTIVIYCDQNGTITNS